MLDKNAANNGSANKKILYFVNCFSEVIIDTILESLSCCLIYY